MRTLVLSLALPMVIAASDSRAASHALTIELVDDHPVGVRVYATATLACVDLGTPIVDALLTMGKQLAVNSDAPGLCVTQTTWPLMNSGYGYPVLFTRPSGSPPVRIRVRGKMINQATPQPTLALPPLVVSLVGKERVGLHIAPYGGKTCEMAANLRVFSGVLEANKPITIETDLDCVCYEQTSAPFVDVSWSVPRPYCRKRACVGAMTKWCPAHPSAPFELAIPSKLP